MLGGGGFEVGWGVLGVDGDVLIQAAPFASVKDAALAMIPYIERELAQGARLHSITRHMLGAFRAVPGARAFRRHLSIEAVKPGADAGVLLEALDMVRDTGEPAHIAA
jgi:tRNA-dihydrouridine synthase A